MAIIGFMATVLIARLFAAFLGFQASLWLTAAAVRSTLNFIWNKLSANSMFLW
jgi:hypothetical protein